MGNDIEIFGWDHRDNTWEITIPTQEEVKKIQEKAEKLRNLGIWDKENHPLTYDFWGEYEKWWYKKETIEVRNGFTSVPLEVYFFENGQWCKIVICDCPIIALSWENKENLIEKISVFIDWSKWLANIENKYLTNLALKIAKFLRNLLSIEEEINSKESVYKKALKKAFENLGNWMDKEKSIDDIASLIGVSNKNVKNTLWDKYLDILYEIFSH